MGDTAGYGSSTNPGGGYSNSQNPAPLYGKNQTTNTQQASPGKPLKSVRFHLCTGEHDISGRFGNDDFIKFFIEGPEIQGASKPSTPPTPGVPTFQYTRWAALNISLDVIPVAKDSQTIKNDLATSLSTEGAFVIYLGHTFIYTDTKKNPVRIDLNPGHVNKKTKDYKKWLISANELTKMINSSNFKASALLLAACSTSRCIGKIGSKTKHVIGIDSGKNLVTPIVSMSFAIESILDNILGYSVVDSSKGFAVRPNAISIPQTSLKKAVELGNTALQSGGVTDKLLLLNGDGNFTFSI